MTTINQERVERLIQQCRRIAAIFDELLPNTALDAPGHRVGGVNPYYNRTESGLYLEFYYGYPSKIWTPGGYWMMTGSTSTPGGVTAAELVEPFMVRLTTDPHHPMSQSLHGCYGPVYKILQIEGEDVEEPGPVQRFHKSTDYLETKSAWAALAEGWRDGT